MAPEAEKLKEAPKQAVVIIHGIGEQTPMATLRSFVETVWAHDPALTAEAREKPNWPDCPEGQSPSANPYWVVPDKRAGSFELRRITTPENDAGVRTDFYEFYWADIMAGNKLRVLVAWLWRLLFRSPNDVPARAFSLWVALWAIVVLLGFSVLVFLAATIKGFSKSEVSDFYLRAAWLLSGGFKIAVMAVLALAACHVLFRIPAWLSTVRGWVTFLLVVAFAAIAIWELPLAVLYEAIQHKVSQIWILIGWLGIICAMWVFILPYFGDAAQYTFASPNTVSKRQELRGRGLQLLRSLHEPGRYARIVLVGHSLGSIIAYDLLQLFWAEQGPSPQNRPGRQALAAFHAVDKAIGEQAGGAALGSDQFRRLQRHAARELSSGKMPWLITDLITLGSPLTHAEFLVGTTAEDFQRLRGERVLSMCPPLQQSATNKEGAAGKPKAESAPTIFYTDDGGSFPNHASVFAAVRWTNLYDPRRLILFGDLIGGPVSGLFGTAIRDLQARINLRWGFFTHTLYWTGSSEGGNVPFHIDLLRKAVNLLDREPEAQA